MHFLTFCFLREIQCFVGHLIAHSPHKFCVIKDAKSSRYSRKTTKPIHDSQYSQKNGIKVHLTFLALASKWMTERRRGDTIVSCPCMSTFSLSCSLLTPLTLTFSSLINVWVSSPLCSPSSPIPNFHVCKNGMQWFSKMCCFLCNVDVLKVFPVELNVVFDALLCLIYFCFCNWGCGEMSAWTAA